MTEKLTENNSSVLSQCLGIILDNTLVLTLFIRSLLRARISISSDYIFEMITHFVCSHMTTCTLLFVRLDNRMTTLEEEFKDKENE
ncbi:transmembrane protein, putative [Medicago truncatula]|uniref:Transmembrane protein, putative n=1 Tax=Medicago truncatula TaxID=3880 RepID=A0A072U101_MEDTR|nr:transmembrane protein, putative [Medicago truncatula]